MKGRVAEVVLVYENAFTYFFSTEDGLGTPMPVYSLLFKAEDLFEASVTEPNLTYYNDIFETYLETA